MSLRDTNAIDFRANHRAIGDVEVLQRAGRRVAGVPTVLVEEEVAEILSPQELEVHREERGVIDSVDVAQIVVELQAVKYRQSLRRTEDVVGQQVSVPVDDAALGDALANSSARPAMNWAARRCTSRTDSIGDHGVRIASAVRPGSAATARRSHQPSPWASIAGPRVAFSVEPRQGLGDRSQMRRGQAGRS